MEASIALVSALKSQKLDRLVRARRILIATDFDGTLTSLDAEGPDGVHPPACEALHRLAAKPSVQIALVSGRRGLDLEELSACLPACWKISDHGRCCRDPQGRLVGDWPSHAGTGPLERAWLQAETHLGTHSDFQVDRKRFSVVVHLPSRLSHHGLECLERWMAISRSFGLEVVRGRRFVEALVPGFDKRRALLRLSAHLRCDFRIFGGDDISDLSTLSELSSRPDGMAVFLRSNERNTPGIPVDATVEGPEGWAAFLWELSERIPD